MYSALISNSPRLHVPPPSAGTLLISNSPRDLIHPTGLIQDPSDELEVPPWGELAMTPRGASEGSLVELYRSYTGAPQELDTVQEFYRSSTGALQP